MAAMAALQSSFTSLNLSSNSFLGHRFSHSLCSPLVKPTEPPCSIVARVGGALNCIFMLIVFVPHS